MDSEKLIEKNLRDKIKSLGGIALKFHCLSFTGFPDRIVLMPKARIYFVELKSEGKKPTKIQLACHKMLSDLGFQVLVISTKIMLEDFLYKVECDLNFDNFDKYAKRK